MATKKAQRDAGNKLLLLICTPLLKERFVEFDFTASDLRKIQKALDDILYLSESEEDSLEETKSLLFGFDYEPKKNDDVAALKERLKEKPVVLDKDEFEIIIRAISTEIDSLQKTNPSLIECLSDAAKIYCCVEDYSKEDYDIWLEKYTNLYYRALNEISQHILDDQIW